jgi:hypothetical protein
MGALIKGVSDEAVVMAVLAAGAALIMPLWAGRGQVWIKADSGRTRSSPKVLLAALVMGAIDAMFVAIPFVDPATMKKPYAWIFIPACIALMFYVFLALLLASRHRWAWDQNGLQFIGNWRSLTIPWTELKCVQPAWDGQICAVGKSGEKICWRPKAILAREELHQAILKARPDLTVPPSSIF